ncbi:MAG: DeoR/GlpR family DNA-binding transcription regulator [Planctomycetota bacterium]
MIARQRQSEIYRDLQVSGAVSVNALAERFEVTDETIRRDLTKLAQGGRVVRTHGGAVLAESDLVEPPFDVRQSANVEAKRAIAARAAAMAMPGDIIAIDASTTGLELAKQLPDGSDEQPITVVSNGLDVVRWLADRPGINVISTGGEFDAAGVCFAGSIAETTLRQFSFRRAFLSCRALDTVRGASESCPAHAAVKRLMLDLAEESYLLADSSKFGQRGACYFAAPDRSTRIITDAGVEPTDVEQVTSAGGNVEVLPAAQSAE